MAFKGLVFDPIKHKYYLNGEPLIGVTTALKEARLIEYFSGGHGMYMDRGTNVHAMTELEDAGALKIEEIPHPLAGYVDGWTKFKDDMSIEILASEEPVCNPIYRYAGTLDRRVIFKGKKAIIDIKSGLSAPWHGLQTMAYAKCFDEPLLRFCLYLADDGRYSLEEHKDPTDWDVFRAALAVVNWKRKQGMLKI